MTPKVLIACPTSDKKDYCLRDWHENILLTQYPNYSLLMVDNSHDDTYHHKIQSMGIECLHVEPKGNATQYIAFSENMIRQYALMHGYDYVFMVESDNFPEPHYLSLMLAHRKLNISIPYFLNIYGREPNLGLQTTPFNLRENSFIKPITYHQSIKDFDGTLKEYLAPSLGCTLINTRVLQSVAFRADRDRPGVFPDSIFHIDGLGIGVKPFVIMSELCEHQRGTWVGNKDLINKRYE